MYLRHLIAGFLLFCATAGVSVADTVLVMVEEKGCIWCQRWNDEVSVAYPKTAQGKAAPLRRIDIHAARPDDLSFARRLSFTPTFVLMVDGKEQSRIEGYPGEDFFWGLLEKMLEDAGIELAS